MRKRKVKHLNVIIGLILLSNIASADKAPVPSTPKVKEIELIGMAGKQRMLSQRIAKDYLYSGKGVAASKANRQLQKSLDDFLINYKKLLLSTNDPEIKNLLEFVKLSSNDFKIIAEENFSIDNAQLILDLSESMLEGSQYIFDSLKKSINLKESEVIVKSAKQLILSQRIAKYYIAYQLGIKDTNSVNSMKNTVEEFGENLNALMKNSTNTPEIIKKLNEINRLWKIVHKFYNNIEKGGLPLIVFNTTDTITKKMNEVTSIYISIHK